MNSLKTKHIDSSIVPSNISMKLDSNIINGFEYVFPRKGCSLIWYGWPENVPKPSFDRKATYHPITVFGKTQIQPRKTLCYGFSYKYSGTPHVLEKEIPEDIKVIMNLTISMYPDADKYNLMCLANSYPTGHHCIGKHSDDEQQMSELRDVVCWVVGATRRLIIRDKKNNDNVLLDVHIPEGIYIMHGKDFQSYYKHEIPREQEALFKKMSELAPTDLNPLQKSDWLSEHPEVIREKMADKYEKYLEWKKVRDSYTMRFFKKI